MKKDGVEWDGAVAKKACGDKTTDKTPPQGPWKSRRH